MRSETERAASAANAAAVAASVDRSVAAGADLSSLVGDALRAGVDAAVDVWMDRDVIGPVDGPGPAGILGQG
jgi:hypothetical protein